MRVNSYINGKWKLCLKQIRITLSTKNAPKRSSFYDVSTVKLLTLNILSIQLNFFDLQFYRNKQNALSCLYFYCFDSEKLIPLCWSSNELKCSSEIDISQEKERIVSIFHSFTFLPFFVANHFIGNSSSPSLSGKLFRSQSYMNSMKGCCDLSG